MDDLSKRQIDSLTDCTVTVKVRLSKVVTIIKSVFTKRKRNDTNKT